MSLTRGSGFSRRQGLKTLDDGRVWVSTQQSSGSGAQCVRHFKVHCRSPACGNDGGAALCRARARDVGHWCLQWVGKPVGGWGRGWWPEGRGVVEVSVDR